MPRRRRGASHQRSRLASDAAFPQPQLGNPRLLNFLERFASDARALNGWPGLLVGDMSQPRGGPMITGHSSHQIGLDVDIWLTPMPDRILTPQEREDMSAVSRLARQGAAMVEPLLSFPCASLARRELKAAKLRSP
jgi:murein endopeptidase